MPSLICLENSQGGCDGAVIPKSHAEQVGEIARKYGVKMHLDGARVLNAMVETGDAPADYCTTFDTISLCFSKGLGCPIGSVLIGSEEDIWYARNMRKMLGGGMRQAGILARAM